MNRRRAYLLSNVSRNALIAGTGRQLALRRFITFGDVIHYLHWHATEFALERRSLVYAERDAAIIH